VEDLVLEALPSAVKDLAGKSQISVKASVRTPHEGSAKDYVRIVDVTATLRLVVMVDRSHNLPSELAKRSKIPDIVLDRVPSLYLCRVEPGRTAVVEEYIGKTVTQMIRSGQVDPLKLIDKILVESNKLY
jgi:hypothetical protein